MVITMVQSKNNLKQIQEIQEYWIRDIPNPNPV